MKNYNFVFGVLLSSILATGAQAVSIVHNADANRNQTPLVTGGVGIPQQSKPGHMMLANASLMSSGSTTLRQQSIDAVANPTFDHFLSVANLPRALYYSEGSSSVQSLRAETKMAQQAAAREDVAEPASELLLLAGLSALAIAIRRQSPS